MKYNGNDEWFTMKWVRSCFVDGVVHVYRSRPWQKYQYPEIDFGVAFVVLVHCQWPN